MKITDHFQVITAQMRSNIMCFVPEVNQWWHHADGKWKPAQDLAERIVADLSLIHI